MKFAIQINASPYASGAGETAYQFISAAISKQHHIFRVFFYFDAIYHAFQFMSPPDDELNPVQRWSHLSRDHNIDLVVCISAAQRRGLLCEDEAKRQNKLDIDWANGFRISGLGQLAEAILEADRFIVFR